MNLDPLPASNDEYWTEVEADVKKLRVSEPVKCEHNFVRMAGNEIKCQKCPIGFFVSPGDELKSGHLYRHGSLVI